MNLSDDCDLLYISCQRAGRTRSFVALSHEASIQRCTMRTPSADRRVQRERSVLRGYAFRRQRPTIHTYAIIIAATLNTIRYSIVLSHCLTGDETGVSALGTMS